MEGREWIKEKILTEMGVKEILSFEPVIVRDETSPAIFAVVEMHFPDLLLFHLRSFRVGNSVSDHGKTQIRTFQIFVLLQVQHNAPLLPLSESFLFCRLAVLLNRGLLLLLLLQVQLLDCSLPIYRC